MNPFFGFSVPSRGDVGESLLVTQEDVDHFSAADTESLTQEDVDHFSLPGGPTRSHQISPGGLIRWSHQVAAPVATGRGARSRATLPPLLSSAAQVQVSRCCFDILQSGVRFGQRVPRSMSAFSANTTIVAKFARQTTSRLWQIGSFFHDVFIVGAT